MPKMKTRKTVTKRIKVTASGKFKKHSPGRGHLLSNKSGNQIRKGRKAKLIPKGYEKQIRRLLGM